MFVTAAKFFVDFASNVIDIWCQMTDGKYSAREVKVQDSNPAEAYLK